MVIASMANSGALEEPYNDEAVAVPVSATLTPLGENACNSTMLSGSLLLWVTRMCRAITGAGAHAAAAEVIGVVEGLTSTDVDGDGSTYDHDSPEATVPFLPATMM